MGARKARRHNRRVTPAMARIIATQDMIREYVPQPTAQTIVLEDQPLRGLTALHAIMLNDLELEPEPLELLPEPDWQEYQDYDSLDDDEEEIDLDAILKSLSPHP